MHACISGAISRNKESVVITDSDKCIGCWTCVMVCPYGVIGRHLETHKSYRCDRCPDRETPACVSSCPTKALIYRTVEKFSKDVRKDAASKLLAAKGGKMKGDGPDYLIIGGSAAGMAASQAIKEKDPKGIVTVLSEEPDMPYFRPLIPYIVTGREKGGKHRTLG